MNAARTEVAGFQARSPQHDGRSCDLCGGREFTLLYEWSRRSLEPGTDAARDLEIQLRAGVPDRCRGTHELQDSGEWWSGKRRQFRRRGAFKEQWQAIRHAITGTGKDRLLRSTRKAAPQGRFLDVGCGGGRMLALASERYDVMGLEPSPIAAERARERGFEVAEETLEQTTLPPASFDVILLDSVIEHVASPRVALQKTHSLLVPGGVVVLLTPKFEGPSSRLHGRDWNGFRHGYHTYLFTGKTLGRYLEETGFEVLHSPRRDRMLDDILVLLSGRKI